MNCPLFVDFVRECMDKVNVLPRDTFSYCTSEKYQKCPFYKAIHKVEPVCPSINNCPVYARFEVGDFEKFVLMTENYCLGQNMVNCKRYILKQSGEVVPENLLPDGGTR